MVTLSSAGLENAVCRVGLLTIELARVWCCVRVCFESCCLPFELALKLTLSSLVDYFHLLTRLHSNQIDHLPPVQNTVNRGTCQVQSTSHLDVHHTATPEFSPQIRYQYPILQLNKTNMNLTESYCKITFQFCVLLSSVFSGSNLVTKSFFTPFNPFLLL